MSEQLEGDEEWLALIGKTRDEETARGVSGIAPRPEPYPVDDFGDRNSYPGIPSGTPEPQKPRRGPPSVDDLVSWGKHKGVTYRELAVRDRGYARWAAMTIGGLKGQLCAEALAVVLGVPDTTGANE